jgi:hypothetical protein
MNFDFKWLQAAFVELFTSLFKFMFCGAKSTDAKAPGKFEDKMKDKIKQQGWGKKVVLALLVFGLSGCTMFTRTVYVPDGAAVRIRKPVQNWPVWVKQKDGTVVEGRITIPEGWFALYNPDWEE